jgi:hypothetical protein
MSFTENEEYQRIDDENHFVAEQSDETVEEEFEENDDEDEDTDEEDEDEE